MAVQELCEGGTSACCGVCGVVGRCERVIRVDVSDFEEVEV